MARPHKRTRASRRTSVSAKSRATTPPSSVARSLTPSFTLTDVLAVTSASSSKGPRKRVLDPDSSSEDEDGAVSQGRHDSPFDDSVPPKVPVPASFPEEISQELYTRLKNSGSLPDWIAAADAAGLLTIGQTVLDFRLRPFFLLNRR
jgi:hypothetical protein